MADVTSKQRHLDRGGVLERGLGDGALLTAFLAKVSMKFDLIAHVTEDKVACSQATRRFSGQR
jgi:hypothetical protein